MLTGRESELRDDSELAGIAAAGDGRAFEIILQRHRARIIRICLRMLGNRNEAEEAAQDSFVKIYFHLRDYDRSRSFTVWSASIAINECRDRLRKRSRTSRMFRDLSAADSEQARLDALGTDNGSEKLDAVEQALEKLPAKLKEVIVLKAYGEHSYDDIAKILKVRVGTVMSRLFRARKKLSEILDRGR